MNRRGFMQRLIGAASVVAVPSTAHAESKIVAPREWPWSPETALRYRGYRIFWTGWKPSQEHVWSVGQWLGYPEHGWGERDVPDRPPYLYLNVPGFIGGPFQPGYVFNLASNGRLKTIHTPEYQSEQWIAQGLDYIKELADAYQGSVGAKIQGQPLYQFPRDADTQKFIIGW